MLNGYTHEQDGWVINIQSTSWKDAPSKGHNVNINDLQTTFERSCGWVTSHKAPAFLCGRRKAKEASWHCWKSCKSLALQSLANLSRPKVLLISRVAPKNSCLKCQILIYFSCVTLGIFGFRNRSPLPHYVDVFRFQQVIFYILNCLRKTGLLFKQICCKTLLYIVKRQP